MPAIAAALNGIWLPSIRAIGLGPRAVQIGAAAGARRRLLLCLSFHLQAELQELGSVAVGVLGQPQPRVGEVHILDCLRSGEVAGRDTASSAGSDTGRGRGARGSLRGGSSSWKRSAGGRCLYIGPAPHMMLHAAGRGAAGETGGAP